MHTHAKKPVMPYGRPKLTVIRNIERSKDVKEFEGKEEGGKEKAGKKLLMPEQITGYIKTRKHDCL